MPERKKRASKVTGQVLWCPKCKETKVQSAGVTRPERGKTYRCPECKGPLAAQRKKRTKKRALKVAVVTVDKDLRSALLEPKNVIDTEMTSLTTVAKVLSGCEASERARILSWLNAYFG